MGSVEMFNDELKEESKQSETSLGQNDIGQNSLEGPHFNQELTSPMNRKIEYPVIEQSDEYTVP